MNPVTHFGEPAWLVAGLGAVPVILLLYWRFDRLQRRRVLAFSVARDTDSALFGISRAMLWVKRVVLCLAVVAACAALARPLGALQLQETERRGLDILFAIDTSRSMLTQDVKPDRLTRAKLAVEDLLDHLTGDGVGLVAFAGESFLQAPVTTDYDAFRETLDALDTHTIAVGGTDLASAIRLGVSTLAVRGDTQKVLVLITDGEDLAGDGILAAQAAAKKGMIIFTLGVGTAAGELIPVPDGNGNTQFVRDEEGKFVKSRLDSQTLTQIAAATGGVYVALGSQDQALVRLYDERLKGFAQRTHEDRQVAVYAELFQWPMAAAIVLLILEWLLGVSVRRRALIGAPVKAAMVAVLTLGLCLHSKMAQASALSAQAEYNQGQYAKAQRDYAQSVKEDPAQSRLQYNLGAAAFKAGDYAGAAAAFNNALQSHEIPLQQSAYYNLGNTLFRQGEKGLTGDPQGTMKTWQQAIGAYDTALQIQPSDADATFNRNIVKTRLEQLKQQQQQKQQEQNPKNKQNPENQQNQQGQQNPQNQHNQQGQQNQKNQQDQQGQQNPQNPPNQQGQPNQQGKQDPQGQQNPQDQPKHPGQQDQQGPAGQQPSPQNSRQGGTPRTQDIGKPDQMSRAEAEQLLDSTKGEERHLAIGMRNGKPDHPAAAPLKDW